MKPKQILDSIIEKYKTKYQFIPTVDVQSFAFSGNGIIVLDINSWRNPNVFFIFSVLHEIGHCETYKARQIKPTREFLATQWAIKEFNRLGLKLKKSDREAWQEYIFSFANENNKKRYVLDWDV